MYQSEYVCDNLTGYETLHEGNLKDVMSSYHGIPVFRGLEFSSISKFLFK